MQCKHRSKVVDKFNTLHYDDVMMTTIASQITSLAVVYSTVYSDANQRKHQSSASLAFVRGIHRDRWIPRTKGQLRGKCFHLMTSSCFECKNRIVDSGLGTYTVMKNVHGPLLLTWFTSNPAWISNNIPIKSVRWNYLSILKLLRQHRWSLGWICSFIPHFIMNIITCPCWD